MNVYLCNNKIGIIIRCVQFNSERRNKKNLNGTKKKERNINHGKMKWNAYFI